jgi:hypothetical protein
MISDFDQMVADNFGKWCGKWTSKGRAFDGSETRYHRLHCKTWQCDYCAPRRAAAYAKAIAEAAEQHRLTRFVTLTLDPKKIGATAGHSCKYLRRCFNKFRVYLGRKFGHSIKYVAVLEFHKSGIAHLHLIVDEYIEWQWLKNAWEAVGGGSHVDIRARKDQHRIAKYLAKYLTKEFGLNGENKCPRGQRRVTCSRGITLLRRLGKHHTWRVLKQSIRWTFGRRCAVASNLEFDQFELIKAFVVKREDSRKLKPDSASYGSWVE